MIEFVITGADHVAHALGRVATQVPLAAREALNEGAQVVESHMQSLSESGLPGPTGRSGRNRDSIQIHSGASQGILSAGLELTGEGLSVSIGPTSPYGRRLELGFHGTDSRGRHYDQGPFPFVEPARDESEGEVYDIMVTAYEAAMAAALEGF